MIHVKPKCPRCYGTLTLEEGASTREGAYTDMVCMACGNRFYRIFNIITGEYQWEPAYVGDKKHNPLLKTYLVSEEKDLELEG